MKQNSQVRLKQQVQQVDKYNKKEEPIEYTLEKQTQGSKSQSDVSELTLKQLNETYPDHLTLIHNDNLYVTPALIGTLDLKLMKINKSDFDKIFELILEINKSYANPLELSKIETYNSYISIIDEPENNMNIIFIINLIVLLNYNNYESFFNQTFYYNKENRQKGEQKGGNPWKKLQEKLQEYYASGGSGLISSALDFTTLFSAVEAINFTLGSPVQLSYVVPTIVILQSIGIRNIMSTTESVRRQLLPPGQLLPRLPRSIHDKIPRLILSLDFESVSAYIESNKFKITEIISKQIRKQFATYSSRSYLKKTEIPLIKYAKLKEEIIAFQRAQGYLVPAFTEEQVEQVDAPIVPPDFITDDQLRAFIETPVVNGANIVRFSAEGIAALNPLNNPQRNLIKARLTRLFPQGIEAQQINRAKMVTLIQRLTGLDPAPAVLQIEQRTYKTINCSNCNKEFCFSANDGYIHQKFDEADIAVEAADRAMNILPGEIVAGADQIRDELLYYSTLNTFPCKQIILSLTPENRRHPSYIFNADFGEVEPPPQVPPPQVPPPPPPSRYGEKLLCSNCSLDQIVHLDPATRPLYFGPYRDSTPISMELVEQLVINLSPVELERVYSKIYNEHRLSWVKFQQMKMNNAVLDEVASEILAANQGIGQAAANVRAEREVKKVFCPVCPDTTVGRFYKVLKKKTLEILYLHCSACGTNFNGCDNGTPYILNKQQFLRYLQNADTCEFIEGEKMLLRRQNGMARVSLRKFKEIKSKEITNKWEKQFEDMNALSVKRCPRCASQSINELGCSAMTCARCRATFCYICGEETFENHGQHDQRHFIWAPAGHITPITSAPYGYWFSVQCVNVNFTIIDPNGNPGIHFPLRHRQATHNQPAGELIRPNPAFAELTRMTWRKFEYLKNKFQNQGFSAADAVTNISAGNQAWARLDAVKYDQTTDSLYELDDPRLDPHVLSRREVADFLARCDAGREERVVHARLVDPIADAADIEGYVGDVAPPGPAPAPRPAPGPGPGPGPAPAPAPAPRPRPQEQEEEIDVNLLNLLGEDAGLQRAILRGLVNNGLAQEMLPQEDLDILQQIINAQQAEEDAEAAAALAADEALARGLQAEDDAGMAEDLQAQDVIVRPRADERERERQRLADEAFARGLQAEYNDGMAEDLQAQDVIVRPGPGPGPGPDERERQRLRGELAYIEQRLYAYNQRARHEALNEDTRAQIEILERRRYTIEELLGRNRYQPNNQDQQILFAPGLEERRRRAREQEQEQGQRQRRPLLSREQEETSLARINGFIAAIDHQLQEIRNRPPNRFLGPDVQTQKLQKRRKELEAERRQLLLPNNQRDPFYRTGDQKPFGKRYGLGGSGGNNFYGGDKLSDEAQMQANIVYLSLIHI